MTDIAGVAAAETLQPLEMQARAGEVRHHPLGFGEKLRISTGSAVDGIGNAALTNFHYFYLTVVCGLSGSLAGASVFLAERFSNELFSRPSHLSVNSTLLDFNPLCSPFSHPSRAAPPNWPND